MMLSHLPQNDSELFGRTIRVNLARPMKVKQGSMKPGEKNFFQKL